MMPPEPSPSPFFIYRILKNWPERNVKLVVATDGESMGSVGDVGVQVRGGEGFTEGRASPGSCLALCLNYPGNEPWG